MLTIATILILSVAGSQPATPVWARPEIRKPWADKVPLSEFRREVQRLKFEEDTIDHKKVRGLFTNAFNGWSEQKNNNSAFELLCVAAYFRSTPEVVLTIEETRMLHECARWDGDYSNIEYALVASSAYTKFRVGKLDLALLSVLKERAKGDPLLGDLAYEIPRAHPRAIEEFHESLETMKELQAKFPFRDEYFLMLQLLTHNILWYRYGQGEKQKKELLEAVDAVVQHKQSGSAGQEIAESIRKRVIGVKVIPLQ